VAYEERRKNYICCVQKYVPFFGLEDECNKIKNDHAMTTIITTTTTTIIDLLCSTESFGATTIIDLLCSTDSFGVQLVL
jgi:hypothetical protein